MRGGSGDDRLAGGAGSDRLFGAAGRDVLIGDAGNDLLNGAGGRDRMTGGRGADGFVFGSGDGRDRITDFDAGADVLRFEGLKRDEITLIDKAQGLQIAYGPGDSIFLAGVSATDLMGDSLVFA